MSNILPPRIDVTRHDIERVVSVFYRKIRKHPTLGPIFAKSIPASKELWEAHEEKIARFWANAILHEKEYSGNPMATHMTLPHVHAEHFAVWLDLFEVCLRETLRADQVDSFDAFARRIGRGLKMGLTYRDTPSDQPPSLR